MPPPLIITPTTPLLSSPSPTTHTVTFTPDCTDDDIILTLPHLPSLTSLTLSGNTHITDAALITLASGCNPGLTALHMERMTGITDVSLTALAGGGVGPGCPRLTHLELQQTPIKDHGILELAGSGVGLGCPLLRTLNLSYTEVGDDAMFALAGGGEASGCPQLAELRLLSTLVTDFGIVALAGGIQQLHGVLDEDQEHHRIWPGCPNLTLLGLERTSITDTAIAALAGLGPLLNASASAHPHRLSIASRLSTELCFEPAAASSADSGVHGCRLLTTLYLYKTAVTDQALRSLSHLAYLSTLDVEWTDVTDTGIKALGGVLDDDDEEERGWGNPRLIKLNIRNCLNITGSSLRTLAAGCPRLETLNTDVEGADDIVASFVDLSLAVSLLEARFERRLSSLQSMFESQLADLRS